jgi:hypothetical protein
VIHFLVCEYKKWLGEFIPVDASAWVGIGNLHIAWIRPCPILDVYYSYTAHLFPDIWPKLMLIWTIANDYQFPNSLVLSILACIFVPVVVIVETGFVHYFPPSKEPIEEVCFLLNSLFTMHSN